LPPGILQGAGWIKRIILLCFAAPKWRRPSTRENSSGNRAIETIFQRKDAEYETFELFSFAPLRLRVFALRQEQ
jgi:hypothetical protein